MAGSCVHHRYHGSSSRYMSTVGTKITEACGDAQGHECNHQLIEWYDFSVHWGPRSLGIRRPPHLTFENRAFPVRNAANGTEKKPNA
jgi:hypothetical protein